jgi:hypothetical protein
MKHAIPLTRDFKTDSLLVINEQGKIRRIYTPFRVLCINSTGALTKNTWVYVQKIDINADLQLLYLITDIYYLYDSFRIYINF